MAKPDRLELVSHSILETIGKTVLIVRITGISAKMLSFFSMSLGSRYLYIDNYFQNSPTSHTIRFVDLNKSIESKVVLETIREIINQVNQ